VQRMAKQRFTAEVVDGAVDLPDRVIEALGGQRVPVRVTVTVNRYTFTTTTAVMGGRRFIGFNKGNRTGAGIEDGQTITVAVERDKTPRVIEAPAELAAALASDATARATWDGLSYTHQREYAQWITEAKKPETRERRAAQAIERLAAGRKTVG